MSNEKFSVGSCFSGIGGLELGLEWTGRFETKWQIENDPYATKVLEKNWPSVKRYSDIRDVVRPESVDLICGGFPCQDVSCAGKRAGLTGKRSTLWSEMYRLICEVKPRWVLVENVPGLLSSDHGQFFGKILRNLADAGYDAEWGVLSAAGVGAPHLRRRVFILAHTSSERYGGIAGMEVCPTDRNDRKQIKNERKSKRGSSFKMDRSSPGNSGWQRKTSWPPEPAVDRVVARFPGQMDRIRCLGNAVVPYCAKKVAEMILATHRLEG